jgi:hypothetical protein
MQGMVTTTDMRPHVHVVEEEKEEEIVGRILRRFSGSRLFPLVCKGTSKATSVSASTIVNYKRLMERLLFSFFLPRSALTLAVARAFSEPIQ